MQMLSDMYSLRRRLFRCTAALAEEAGDLVSVESEVFIVV